MTELWGRSLYLGRWWVYIEWVCMCPVGQTKLMNPSPSPEACSNLCPLSWWCHPIISSSVVPCFSCLPSFPALGSFLKSWLFTPGGQIIGPSASVSVLPVKFQDWFSLRLTSFISFQSKGLLGVSSNTTVKSISSLVFSLLYGPTLTSIHDYWRNHSFD